MFIISIDPGKDGAYSIWEDTKWLGAVSWHYNPHMLVCDNLKAVCEQIIGIIENKKNVVVVIERPHTSLAYQWCLYYDIRDILVRKKVSIKSRKDKKNFKFVALAPIKIKSIVTGNRFAKKEQVRESIIRRGIDVSNQNEHAVDSVAVGLAYLDKLETDSTRSVD